VVAKTNPATTGTAASDRLAGVVSYGDGCGQQGSPGVYTSVVAIRDWITYQADAVSPQAGARGWRRRQEGFWRGACGPDPVIAADAGASAAEPPVPPPPSPQYPRPCDTPTNISFAQVSADRPWSGPAAKTTKLASASDAVPACEALCRAAVDTSGSQKGCLAYAVTTNSRGATFCHQYKKKVPLGACGAGDAKGLCSRASQGAYRLVFSYAEK
jgi:hypothetical protein